MLGSDEVLTFSAVVFDHSKLLVAVPCSLLLVVDSTDGDMMCSKYFNVVGASQKSRATESRCFVRAIRHEIERSSKPGLRFIKQVRDVIASS